jgi:hypothetical protein
MTSPWLRGAHGAGLIALVCALVACASPADKQAMVVGKDVKVAKPQPYSVDVVTSGGAETGALDSSNIGNADLKAAIEASIAQTQVFKEVVQGRNGQYELTVAVVQLSKPSIGFSFTVDLELGWTLTRLSDKQVAFRKSIQSTFTAPASAAFAGAVRLRLAVEGATRANIEQGLRAIGDLNL